MSVEPNGLFGKAGEVSVQVKSVNAVDGTKVMLSGSNISDTGKSKLGAAIILTICCLFHSSHFPCMAFTMKRTVVYVSVPRKARRLSLKNTAYQAYE